ncbi:B12-binding domain-containing radical SAM protein [Paludibaculum fermentans]|uniref:Cobalamin-dependent protein n=1 Tax=Paludibaculum fermentans TaxID=1473598 RepID=A0A7S7NUK4_PALFE|nr:radical SAM protein [Paludibaculum fermentans]QOY90095.1 cobalamin-dependent protein [Paludibaculum fermentans]
MTTHPKGRQARVLLTSVFGPYAQDDQYGSRSINPMELYHNQVTRAQGPYSLRIFHRSWGIMFIQRNIENPSTVLDFPLREDFERELTENQYDVVGISSIIVNVGKVREMCKIVRRLSPHSTIVVGGHIAAIPGLDLMLDADHIVKGEGVGWMRSFLDQDPTLPVVHPQIASGFGHRVMGLKLPGNIGSTAATIIPSVGCPMGCNFCTTSAFFGGKGKFINFFDTGRQIYDAMAQAEEKHGFHSFFVMDENFLLHRKRAMELLDCMRKAGKSWELYVFSSANAIQKYTMEELIELGISWIWMGLESPLSGYSKLNGSDTMSLTHQLRAHGIRVLGSSIVGMEHHTPQNIESEIDYACAHETDFHQFMLYTPLPGTPLHAQMTEEGRMIDVDLADVHGQWKFNWRHPHISLDESKRFLDNAFGRDFELNGPSLYRICRTTLEGIRKYRLHPDLRVRQRFEREAATMRTSYSALLWAMERHLKVTNATVSAHIHTLRQDIRKECGSWSTAAGTLLGPIMLWLTRREEKRLDRGVTYEPETFIERRNWASV